MYFGNGTPLSQLIAKASRNSTTTAMPAALGALKTLPPQPDNSSGPIALQVIPYKP